MPNQICPGFPSQITIKDNCHSGPKSHIFITIIFNVPPLIPGHQASPPSSQSLHRLQTLRNQTNHQRHPRVYHLRHCHLLRIHLQRLQYPLLLSRDNRTVGSAGSLEENLDSGWVGGQIRSLEFALLLYLVGEVDTKEVVFGVLDQWEGKDGVDVGGNNKAYLHNITSGLVCFPIALALWRGQAMPAVRTAMLLCVFSQANDLIIESRRKRIFDSKYSSEQLKKREVQQHVAKVEADLKEVL